MLSLFYLYDIIKSHFWQRIFYEICMKKISVIVPVYNEKQHLSDILREIENVDFGLEKEIILVDDGSFDGTKDLYADIPHKVLYHEKNRGKGAAIKTGIEAAAGDIIVIQDADLEYNPQDYVPIVKLIVDNEADVVYGSRFLDKTKIEKFYFLSFIANKTLTFLTQILFSTKLTDMETCYKAFRADIIKNIRIESDRYDFEPEITAKILKQKVRYKELPISYKGRSAAEGKKIGWKDGLQAIWTLFKFRFFD